MVKLHVLVKQHKKEESNFVADFVAKRNTMARNINQALHVIKSHQFDEQIRMDALDLKVELDEGTRHASISRMKPRIEDDHMRETLKVGMKAIMEIQPLLMRTNMKIPIYPKIKFNQTMKQSSLTTLFKCVKDRFQKWTSGDMGFMTETELQMINIHTENLENSRSNAALSNENSKENSKENSPRIISIDSPEDKNKTRVISKIIPIRKS